MVRPTQSDESYRDSPTAWFAVLEVARREQDFERAAEAVRQLKRLGVIVRFTPPQVEAAR